MCFFPSATHTHTHCAHVLQLCVVGLIVFGVVHSNRKTTDGNSSSSSASQCDLPSLKNKTVVHVPGLGSLLGRTPDGSSVAYFKGASS